MFTYPNVRQCFAVTALLSGFVPKSATFSSLLILCTFILHPQVRHIYVLQLHCVLWPLHQCSTLASLQNPNRASCFGLPLLPTLPMLLHTVLPLCNDLLLSCVAFRVCPPSIRTPALDDFRVSLQPALSETVNTVSSSSIFSIFEHLSPLSLTFQIPGKPFEFGKTLLVGDSTSSGTIRSR